jgi:hypothetical protein
VTIIPYINRPAPFPLDPAVALLGNVRQGAAFDFLSMRGYVRDRSDPGNFFLGDPNSKLTYTSPSPKYVCNGFGVLVSGTTLRCDHDPSTLADSATSLHSLGVPLLDTAGRWVVRKVLTTTGSVVYTAGQHVRITLASDIGKWMLGRVVSHAAGTLTVDLYATTGYVSGASWKIIVARGLLVEGARTNQIVRAEEISTTPWQLNAASVNINVATAPDGAMTADKLVENTATSGHNVRMLSIGYLASTTYTCSIFAKAGERSVFTMVAYTNDVGGNRAAHFNLATGTVASGSTGLTGSQSITPYPNGWFRCVMTFTTTATIGTTRYVDFRLSSTPTPGPVGDSYTGDGASGLHLWGVQLEEGAFPSSYIKTEGSQVTRAADNITLALSALPFDAARVSGMVDHRYNGGSAISPGSRAALTEDASGANTNRFFLVNPSGNATGVNVVSGGVTSATLGGNAPTDAFVRTAFRLEADNMRAASNGILSALDNSGAMPVGLNTLRFGRTATGGHLDGHIRSVVLVPDAWSDTELQARTAP